MLLFRRLLRLANSLLAVVVFALAVAAPGFLWSAAPDMASVDTSAETPDQDEDVPSEGESDVELEAEQECVDASSKVAFADRYSTAVDPPRELLSAAQAGYARLPTPPPES